MPDTITVGGVIATEPKHVVTTEGLKITSFRLASQQRRFDRAQDKWIDAETNWFTVTAFRQLAENAQASLKKGDRVLVRGRLRMRDWTSGERTGVSIEIEAEGMGHDLAWGRTEYRRVLRTPAADATESAPEDSDAPPIAEQDAPVEDAVPVPF
jgi:single-strand DNA-binding protein